METSLLFRNHAGQPEKIRASKNALSILEFGKREPVTGFNISDTLLIKEPHTELLFTPVFWPGEFQGLYNPCGCKESDKIKISLASNYSQQ